MKVIAPPVAGTYTEYQKRYIDLITAPNILQLMESHILDLKVLLSEIPYENEDFAYAEGKWTIKQLVGHMLDTERILAYRAMCIARGEQGSLPGFDENAYVNNASFNDRALYDLGNEFSAVRESTILLFRYMSDIELDRVGTANNTSITPRALLYMIAGHYIHHDRILRERYASELL
jgi:hypothetical protein